MSSNQGWSVPSQRWLALAESGFEDITGEEIASFFKVLCLRDRIPTGIFLRYLFSLSDKVSVSQMKAMELAERRYGRLFRYIDWFYDLRSEDGKIAVEVSTVRMPPSKIRHSMEWAKQDGCEILGLVVMNRENEGGWSGGDWKGEWSEIRLGNTPSEAWVLKKGSKHRHHPNGLRSANLSKAKSFFRSFEVVSNSSSPSETVPAR